MDDLKKDVEAVRQIAVVPSILNVIASNTGMRFVAVARVTPSRWVACEVLDNIHFGLKSGGELPIESTICNEVRSLRAEVLIDHVAEDPSYVNHHTPAIYGFESYVSVPIILADGEVFGSLCAIDPEPRKLKGTSAEAMFKLFAELIAFHLDANRKLDASEANLVASRADLARSKTDLADSEASLAVSRADLIRSKADFAQSEDDLKSSRLQYADSQTELAASVETGELREQFIAVLGHDLRNPLASVAAGLKLLSKDITEQPGLRIARLMGESLQRMNLLIDNLLDFARGRLGSGIGLDISKGERIEPVLAAVVNEIRSAHPDRKIELHFELPRDVDVDKARIAQMFSNLLGNAITHGTPDQPIEITAKVVGDYFELAVCNGGDPIPEAAMQRLFHPFYRGEVRPSQQGLGLGLYIASEIAKAHRGTLEVTSDNTQTCFIFRMPLA